MNDPYVVLGLSADVDDETIRRRYLELVKQFSPEKHPEKFAAIRQAYEATRDLPLEPATVEAWCGNVEVEQLQGRKLTVVPILRAGLGMLDGVLDVIPCAKISVIGMSRNEATLEPRLYVSKLVPHIEQRRALLVDPMLATGGSLFAAIRLLKQAGCQHIRAMVLVAAPDAIARLEQQYPDVDVYTAVIDSHLDANGFIIPGLGDAGDRIMGTVES